MGLLLSVLVACVGVVELFAFYANVSRNFISASAQTNLIDISRKYFENLEQQRQERQNQLPNGNCFGDHGSTTITAKEVVTEYLNVIETRSRSPSPRKLFSRTKEITKIPKSLLEKSEVETTESKDVYALNHNHVVQEQDSAQNCVTKNDDKTEVLCNLPEQASVVEVEEAFTIVEVSKPRSRSPSPISNQLGKEDVAFRRSPSPYPSLVLPVPRNSISNEPLDNASVSVAEVDEESISRSPTPEKIHVILESKHNSVEYWTNKVLVVPPIKPTRSRNTLENKKSENTDPFFCSLKSEENISIETSINQTKERTERPTLESILSHDSEISTKDDDEIENEIKEYDAQFLDSVDGVKKKKLSRSSSSRRSRKKRTPNMPVDYDSKDDCLSSSSMQNNEAHTAKTLTEAANVLKNVNSEAGGPSISTSGSKDCKTEEPEPFWLIFSGEYTKAMNKDWHGQHFCCWQCDESLTGQRYVLRDEHPYCVSCYESVFANACEKCSRTIGIDSKDLSYKDKHWHEACFLCTTCGESLVDRQFGSKGDRIYCGRCYDEQFASRCDGCHEIFRAGTKKMEYKTRQWHEKCFCCCVCKVPIGTQSFIPREQEIYCAKCYEEKFATRCIKCNKVITSGGVTYKNEPWHRECFTCTHCSKSLAGERFTSRDEKPYCAECFGELFAKRCFACNKPITGIGGTKFISFEDRHWHNDCFFCASCRTSLVGRGFITDQDDIICPECAKQKLM